MSKVVKTINLAPTWGYAVTVYCAVLESDTASEEAKQGAREDLARLASIVDNMGTES